MTCTKCGAECSPTPNRIKHHMIWCQPCIKKQPWYQRERRAWGEAIKRCTNPKNPRWSHYGGRGIKVCERWLASYENFLSDMGPCPSPKHSLDRKDNDGNYEPGNCRWATRIEQQRNLSTNRLVVFQGRQMPIAEAAERSGLNANTVWTRIDRGWPEGRWFEPLVTKGTDSRR